MKLTAIAAFLAASMTAHAANTVAIFPNEGGGAIVFSDTPCNKNSRIVVTYTKELFTAGFWLLTVDGKAIMVMWDDGTASSFPIDQIAKPQTQEWE